MVLYGCCWGEWYFIGVVVGGLVVVDVVVVNVVLRVLLWLV